MTVNVKLQCLATLTIPTGLYAFYRINKTKEGNRIYMGTGIVTFVFIVGTFLMNWNQVTNSQIGGDLLSLLFTVGSIAVTPYTILFPMIKIRKYSKEYNQKTLSTSDHTPIYGKKI